MFSAAMRRLIAIGAGAILCGVGTAAPANTLDQSVNDTRAFIEFTLGFKLDPATLQAVRNGVASDMATDPSGSAASLKQENDFMALVRTHPESAALLRSLVEPRLIAAWQSDTSNTAATSRAVVAAWRQHKVIVADGHPPLHQSVVNAYISLFEFVSKESGKPVPAAVQNHAAFVARIAKQYTAASPAAQLQFNNVQTLWIALQTIWAHASDADKAAIRQAWRSHPTAENAVAARTYASASHSTIPVQSDVNNWSEHIFVQDECQNIVSSWSNPF